MYWLSLVLIYLIHDRVGVVSIEQNADSRIAVKNKHDKYIELFVVVDHLTYSYHGDDTEKYVIEMLKMAATLWDSPTLGVDIGLILAGIEILSEPHPLLHDVVDANAMLMDFRRWLSRDQPSRYLDFNFDVAILITRKDLHIDSNYDATGKGFVGGTCIEDMKMAVVEDGSPMGLATSIAHELGHLLGMYHDYQYSKQECPDKTFIMSGFAVGGQKSMQWSPCSSDAIQRFIKGRRTNCLQQYGTGLMIIGDKFEGVRYTAEYQCTMLRRQKSFGCQEEDSCSELFCTTSNLAEPCVTDHRPPLDGTRCGENKWCQQGICVYQPIKIELNTEVINMDIKRFGVGAPSAHKNAHLRFLDISWKVALVFALIILFKQMMNFLRLCSSHVLYRIRNGQIQIV